MKWLNRLLTAKVFFSNHASLAQKRLHTPCIWLYGVGEWYSNNQVVIYNHIIKSLKEKKMNINYIHREQYWVMSERLCNLPDRSLLTMCVCAGLRCNSAPYILLCIHYDVS